MTKRFVVGFIIGVILSSVLSSCSTIKNGSGPVAQQIIACVDPDVCKKQMAEDCKNGGVIYKVAPAIAVQYSCNP